MFLFYNSFRDRQKSRIVIFANHFYSFFIDLDMAQFILLKQIVFYVVMNCCYSVLNSPYNQMLWCKHENLSSQVMCYTIEINVHLRFSHDLFISKHANLYIFLFGNFHITVLYGYYVPNCTFDNRR